MIPLYVFFINFSGLIFLAVLSFGWIALGIIGLASGVSGFKETLGFSSKDTVGMLIVGIVIEDFSCVERVNEILHEYSELIIGRIGLPYKERGVSVISLIVDGVNDDISALTGKLGRISGASVKSMVTKSAK